MRAVGDGPEGEAVAALEAVHPRIGGDVAEHTRGVAAAEVVEELHAAVNPQERDARAAAQAEAERVSGESLDGFVARPAFAPISEIDGSERVRVAGHREGGGAKGKGCCEDRAFLMTPNVHRSG